MYSKEFINKLIDEIDLKDVAEDYIDLFVCTDGFRARCPFCEDEDFSFVINYGDTHRYFCKNCDAHGNIITFLMNHESMTLEDAIENLCETFDIEKEKIENKCKKHDCCGNDCCVEKGFFFKNW